MFHTTRAIALRIIKHGERSVVLTAYTEAFGTRAYLVRGGRNKAAPRPQPLDRLELVVSEDQRNGIQTAREWRVERPYVRTRTDHARGLLLLFAQEVLYRTLREEVQDQSLFIFVQDVLEEIDSGEDLAHLPLFLLLRLAGQLGFRPEMPDAQDDGFDLREGRFFSGPAVHGYCMDKETSGAFMELMRAEQDHDRPQIDPAMRKVLLEQQLTYFRLHVAGFGQLSSPEVIHAVLS